MKKEKKKKKKNPTSRLSFFVILFCKKEMFFSLKKIRVVNTRKKMREKGDTKKQTINGILFSENQNKIRNHIRRTKRCVRAMFNYLTIFSLSPSPSIITICAAGIVEFERKRDRKRKRRNFLILLPKKKLSPGASACKWRRSCKHCCECRRSCKQIRESERSQLTRKV